MPLALRGLAPSDLDPLVELSLRAWEPVFTTWRGALGDRIYDLAYPDWRRTQAAVVRSVCEANASTTVVAELDGRVVGFAVVVVGEPDDVGHAPARSRYEGAGFTPLPVVHYYRALGPAPTEASAPAASAGTSGA